MKEARPGGGDREGETPASSQNRSMDTTLARSAQTQRARESPDWVKEAVIYCAYPRSASPEGTFTGIEKRLPELRGIGVTVLWLMPIHPVGLRNRKGSLGSPYSVRDYYAINPEFGTLAEFQHLLNAAHDTGLKVILDLVANHTSWDSRLIEQHPEWFTRDSTGKIVSPNSDWTDVADLDYSKKRLRGYMMEMMEWWVREMGIDGFRCDVSELVAHDFWVEAAKRLRPIKPVMMLSEGSLPEQHLSAFDLTYSWNLYDLLDPLIKGRPASDLGALLQAESREYPRGSLRLRFNTNHDKNAWDSPAVLKFGDALKLTAVLIATIPGVPLLYTGEEVANDKKLSLFEKIAVDWNRPKDMETLYTGLFQLRKKHSALSEGAFAEVPTTSDRLCAFLRTDTDDRVLTVLNFSADSVWGELHIPPAMEDGRPMKGYYSGIDLVPSGQVQVKLPPRGYEIFVR